MVCWPPPKFDRSFPKKSYHPKRRVICQPSFSDYVKLPGREKYFWLEDICYMCHSCGGGRKKSVFFSVFLLWLVTIMGDRNWFFWKKCQFRLAHLLLGEKVSGEKTKLTKQPLPSPPTTNVAKNNHDMFCWYLEKTHVSQSKVLGFYSQFPKFGVPFFGDGKVLANSLSEWSIKSSSLPQKLCQNQGFCLLVIAVCTCSWVQQK